MVGSTVQLLSAVCMEAELFSSSHRQQFGEWEFRALYSFHGQPDGSFPYGALLRGPSGKIYGTTYYGGENGIGAVYELSPRSVGEWDGRVIYSFQTGSDGNSPISNLVRDAAGNLYGTTS